MTTQLSISRKILFSIIVTVLLFAMIEGALRLFGFKYEPQYSIFVENRWSKHGVGPDPTLPWSWMPIPGAQCVIDNRSTFRFNSLGYRGDLFEQKKAPDSIRVICLGDSGTMGWGVKDQETYCAVMEELIQSGCNKKVETINAGVFGYSSFQGVHQLKTRIVDLKPDFITFCYNWNDHGGAIRIADQPGLYAWNKGSPQRDKDLHGVSSLGGLNESLQHLRIYQLLNLALSGSKETGKPGNVDPEGPATSSDLVRVPLEDYRENLLRVVEISQKNNITPVLLTQALNPKSKFPRDKHDAYNEIVIQVATEKNVPYVDPRVLLGDDTTMFSSNTHPTRKAHQKIAAAIAEKIISNGCTSTPRP